MSRWQVKRCQLWWKSHSYGKTAIGLRSVKSTLKPLYYLLIISLMIAKHVVLVGTKSAELNPKDCFWTKFVSAFWTRGKLKVCNGDISWILDTQFSQTSSFPSIFPAKTNLKCALFINHYNIVLHVVRVICEVAKRRVKPMSIKGITFKFRF